MLSLRFRPDKNAAEAPSTVLMTPWSGAGSALVATTLERLGRVLVDFLETVGFAGAGLLVATFLLGLTGLVSAGAATTTTAGTC